MNIKVNLLRLNMETTKTNSEKNVLIQNQYNLGKGGFTHWFEKVSLLWLVELKKLVKTPMVWFAVVGVPMILLFGIGSMIQDWSLLAPCFGITPVVVAGIVFGDLYYSMENSTMKQATNTSNYGYKTKLFTIATVTLFVTFVSMAFELLVFMTLESAEIFFMPSYMFNADEHYRSLKIQWGSIQWFNMFYFIIVNILLTIAMLTFAKNFFATNRTLTMFTLVYLICDIMFGGILLMNYNRVVVTIDSNGVIHSTDCLANINTIKTGENNVWSFDSWYGFTKFFTPHYFINQQFAGLLKVGATQQTGAYWFDADGIFHVNWDLAFYEQQALAAGEKMNYSWMLDAQNMILGTPGNTDVLSNEQFASAYEALTDYSGAYEAFYSYNQSFPPTASFWKAYDGDYTFTLSVILPWAYIVGLTWAGFTASRIADTW